jgi:CHAT domain-containing protein
MSRLWVITLGAFGALGLAFGCGSVTLNSGGRRVEIIHAVGACRFTEARLTGGFPFLPWNGYACEPADRKALERMDRDVGRKLPHRPTPELLADAGLLNLIAGHTDEAITLLERAVAARPKNSMCLSDLGAAYLTRSAKAGENGSKDLLRALLYLNDAIAADNPPAEAYFNRAIALNYAALTQQAKVAFQDYLLRDPLSPWDQEVGLHLSALRVPPESILWQKVRPTLDKDGLLGKDAEVRRIVTEFPQMAKSYAERELLTRWAVGRSRGKLGDASEALFVARAIGSALTEVTGDHMIEGAVAAIDRAVSGNDLQLTQALVKGHLAYAEGIRLFSVPLDSEALLNFDQATLLLAKGRSPLRAQAVVRAENCDFYLGRCRRTLDRLTSLRGEVDPSLYPGLMGQLLLIVGKTNLKLGNLGISFGAYESALAHFIRTGERENIAATQFMMAENLRFQGETEQAWAYRHKALGLAVSTGSEIYIHNTLLDSAEAALTQDLPRVALLFQDEMIIRARDGGDDLILVESILRRSRAEERIGDIAAALHDLDDARKRLARVLPSPRQEQLEGNLRMATGEVELHRSPSSAVEQLSVAIDFCRTHNSNFRLPYLYLKRGLAFLALGQEILGEADFKAGIEECEAQRERVLDEQLRISYGDQMQEVFEEMVRFQASHLQRADQAFTYAEMARTRNLLETVAGTETPRVRRGHPSLAVQTLSADAVRRELPKDTVLIEYAVWNDRTLVWVLKSGSLRQINLSLGSGVLAGHIDSFRASLRSRAIGSVKVDSEKLYDLLVRPMEAELQGASRLVIVPDKSLHLLPFAALLRHESGRYLVQDWEIVYAPSATLFVKSSHRTRELAKKKDYSALIVGGPNIDIRSSPDLAYLGGASTEVKKVASLYKGAKILGGDGATKAAFLFAAPSFAVIHLGSHSIINVDYPLLSALMLAPSPLPEGGYDKGALYAHEIYRLKLQKTRLVVLAGCGTASGRVSSSEGVASLVRPFLAAGVPSVLGSLWEIDDPAAASLFVMFHRNVLEGQDPAVALRNAQLEVLARENQAERQSFLWAPFVMLGGLNP